MKATDKEVTLYYEYIKAHRLGVQRTWVERLMPVVMKEIKLREVHEISELLSHHDESKLLEPELSPYAIYYSDHVNCPKTSSDYREAWLHHQKTNPHHWQYWVILNDETNPQFCPLEMPLKYVIEMLCDWQSASDYYGNTAHWWYETQKSKMILHTETKKLVEKYLRYLD